jgi:alpha-mannosidase
VQSDNVIVTAMKKTEDANALTLRFYEWAGKAGDVTLQLPAGAESASETDLMERPTGPLSLASGKVSVPTKPFEIKTIRVQFSGTPNPATAEQQ